MHTTRARWRGTLIAVALVAGLLAISGPTAGPAAADTGFPDVPDDHLFAEQITWMVDQEITAGYPDGTFKPGASITRQSMAAFLHRLAGSPTAPPLPPTFSDVSTGHPFAEPISWMIAAGITTGYPDGTFRPTEPVTRQSMAAFLHRAAGEPTGPFPPLTFSDVSTGSPFATAIAWMVAFEITTGYPDGTYKPAAPVTRQSMAAFLFRAVGTPEAWDLDAITIAVDPPDPGDVRACDDFTTWADADRWFQWFLAAHGDVADLDPDDDGIPCEDLPGAPDDGDDDEGELSDDLDAPALDSGVPYNTGQAAEFLYEGPGAVQTGVAPDAIDPVDPSVLRGRVLDTTGAPLAGVTVTVVDHPEYGQTLTRDNGRWDLAANASGAPLVMRFELTGHLPVQRALTALPGEYSVGDDVALTPVDPAVTTVDLDSATVQVAAASEVADADGTRQNVTVVPAGTGAELVLPDGTHVPATELDLRATEYTVGDAGEEAMPGELPPSSAYTYAVEISDDDALAAEASVEFDQPVYNYVDNFLDFPVGSPVPAGWYDAERDSWVPSDNGIVVEVVGETAGRADLDVDGDGAADTGTALDDLGVTDAEREVLADRYAPGDSLWRVPLTHLTPWDYNWPYGCEDTCDPPGDPAQGGPGQPTTEGDPLPGGCEEGGSIIRCQDQALADVLPLAGTSYALRYSSSSAPGMTLGRQARVPITGTTLPPGVARIEATIKVAGQRHTKEFPASPNQVWEFAWDGNDAFGRPVLGSAGAELELTYVYAAVYKAPADFAQSFRATSSGNLPARNPARSEISSTGRRTWTMTGAPPTVAPEASIGGWQLNEHHRYSPQTGEMTMGDGTVVRASSAANLTGSRLIGTGVPCNVPPCGEGTPGSETPVEVGGLAVDPQGRVLFIDSGYLRRIDPADEGRITTLAGTGVSCPNSLVAPCELDVPALGSPIGAIQEIEVGPDGAIHLLENVGTGTVIRTIDADGILRHTAGTEEWCNLETEPCGEGGPATEAFFRGWDMAVAPDGAIFAGGTAGIWRIEPGGTITRPVGCRPGPSCVPHYFGAPVDEFRVTGVNWLDVAPDGSLYFDAYASWNSNTALYRVTADGMVLPVAGLGDGCSGSCGLGGPALTAPLDNIGNFTVTGEGRVVVLAGFDATAGNHRVYSFEPGGTLEVEAGGGGLCMAPSPCPEGLAAAAAALPSQTQFLKAYGRSGLLVGDIREIDLLGVAPQVGGVASPPGTRHAIADPDGTAVHLFDGHGRHLGTQAFPSGELLRSFAYDTEGRLATITDGHGNVTTFERNAQGQVTTVAGPFGQETQLTYDAVGYLAAAAYSVGRTVSLTHSAGGLLTQRVDPGGATHTFEYDASGRLIRDVGPDGLEQTLTRTGTATDSTVTVAATGGRATQYRVQQDDDGTVTRTVTDAAGGVSLHVREPDGTTVLTDPDGTVTEVTWAADPALGASNRYPQEVVETPPTGPARTVTQERDLVTQPFQPLAVLTLTDMTTVNGRTSTRVWDTTTRATTTTSPEGRVSQVVIDEEGKVTSSHPAPDLTPLTYTYDERGFLETITAGSRTTTLAFDAGGRLVGQTDDSGDTTTFGYDAADRRTSVTLPSGRVATSSYDARGNRTGVELPGPGAYVMGYSAADRPTTFDAPGLGTETRSYDVEGLLDSVALPSGQTLDVVHDAAGRITAETVSGAGSRSTSYNDASDRPATTTGTPPSGPASTLAFTWSGPAMTGVTATGGSTWSASWERDADRWVTGIDVTSGTDVVHLPITRDGDGRITAVDDFTLTRNGPGGSMSAIGDGSGAVTIDRNGFAEPTDRALTVSSATRYREQTTIDDEGRITQAVETDPSGATVTSSYTYDEDGQLTSTTVDGATTTYAYDVDGNPTTGPSGTATFDAGGRATTVDGVTRTYDGNGRLSGRGADTFTWSPFGELRSVTVDGQTVAYSNDALGRRTRRTLGAATTEYLYADPGNPYRLTGWRGADGVLATVLYDDDGIPVAIRREATTWYVGADHLGTIKVISDASGAVVKERTYDPWGRLVTDSAPGIELPLGFAGGVEDPLTGLVRFGARDYDPTAGTWTAPDPARFAGGFGLYAYAGNDPVNRKDPTGLYCIGGSAYDGIGGGVEICTDWNGKSSICFEVGIGVGAGLGNSNGQPADTGWSAGVEASIGCGPTSFGAGVSWTRNECPDGRLGRPVGQAQGKAGIGPINVALASTDGEPATGQISSEGGGLGYTTRPGCEAQVKAVVRRCVAL
jgi:RHS repeat-associated protein